MKKWYVCVLVGCLLVRVLGADCLFVRVLGADCLCVCAHLQSQAKLLHLHDRIQPLVVFFRLRASGKTITASSALVAKGSMLCVNTIETIARDFLKEANDKKQFIFSRFRMGHVRSRKSVMWDERIRARATVWLRLQCSGGCAKTVSTR